MKTAFELVHGGELLLPETPGILVDSQLVQKNIQRM